MTDKKQPKETKMPRSQSNPKSTEQTVLDAASAKEIEPRKSKEPLRHPRAAKGL